MKKVSALFLAVLLAVSCIACGSAGQGDRKEAGSGSPGTASSAESMEIRILESTAAAGKSDGAAETSGEETSAESSAEEAQEEETTVIRAAVGELPESLDPFDAETDDQRSVFAALCTGLYFMDVNYKGEAELSPGIAEDWPEFSEDGLTATIRLRETFWSDGTPLTAADFSERLLELREKFREAGKYDAFSAVFAVEGDLPFAEAQDRQTLVIRLSCPCLYLADILAETPFLPVRSYEPGEELPDVPVTNGAFTLGSRDEKSWTLVKNPCYFEAERVSADELCFEEISGSGNQFLAYKGGDVDVIGQIPASVRLRYANDSSLITQRLYTVTVLRFDGEAAVFQDRTPGEAAAIREAVNLLIDRQILKSELLGDKYRLAETLVSPGMSDGNGGIFEENRSFFNAKGTGLRAIDTARELLEGAGFTLTDTGNGFFRIEPELKISIGASEEGNDQEIARGIAEDLSFLGIEAEVTGPDEPCTAVITRISAAENDAWSVLREFSQEAGGTGFSGADERFQLLGTWLSEARALTDPDRRAQALKDAESLIFDTWMVLPLYYENDSFLLARDVTGIYETPFGVRMYLYAERY